MGLTLGVAGNDIDAENYGGLKLLTQLAGGGAEGEKRALAAIAGAQALSPATEKVDAAQLAIRFFSQMGANASRPGATLLGSAAESLPTAANYLAEVNKRNKELERARGPLAVQLATALKPPKLTKPTMGGYTLAKDIDGIGKAGKFVTMSNVLADAFVTEHGIDSLKEFKTPLVNISDKAQSKFGETLATASANSFVDQNKAAVNAQGTITDLNTMYEMISELSGDGEITDEMLQLETGPIQDLTLGLKSLAVGLNVAGVDMDTEVANATAFRSLVNKVTLGTVAQLKGPLSEKELGFLQAVQPLLGNTVNGNKLIILIQKHAAEKAVNYGKFVSEWRNQEVDGKMRGNPKNTGEFDNMMDAWRQTDDYKIQMPDYISKVTKDFGRKLLENDLEQSRTSGVRIYEIDPDTNNFTEEGKAKFIFDINKRIPRTTLNRILGKQNIKDLLSKIREDL